jgi:dihydrofolate reductase
MGKVVLYMSMSVDGFIAGHQDSEGTGWASVASCCTAGWPTAARTRRPTARRRAGATVFDEMMTTGAVMPDGGRSRSRAAGQATTRHPIFVLTRAAPAQPPRGSAHYVTDIATGVAEAKAAAGDRDILHGAATAQECLRAGLLDELELQLIPVLLGQGRRLFADLPLVELELVRALDGPDVQHLRYRVGG